MSLRRFLATLLLPCAFSAGIGNQHLVQAQTVVDFREAIRTIEPSIVKLELAANRPAAQQGPRFEWLNQDGNVPRGGVFNGRRFPETSSTAFAVEEDLLVGYVGDSEEAVSVVYLSGESATGTVVARDLVTGLAAIQVQDAVFEGLIVSAAEVEPGMPIVASWIESDAIVSDAGMIASRPIPQDTRVGAVARIDFGNGTQRAGSPVVDASGIVVGVMVPSQNGRLVCVRSRQVLRLVETAKSDKPTDLRRGLVGIKFESRQFGEPGALVMEVNPESGAANAGIKAGDLIERVNEIQIRTASNVQSAIASFRAGDTVEITLLRDGESILLPVTLTEHPNQKLAQSGGFNQPFAPGNGFGMRRAWELRDGKLVPMEIAPDQPFAPQMPQAFQMDDVMKQLQEQFGGPGMQAQPFANPELDGLQIERSDVEESLQELKQQLQKLNEKLSEQDD